MSQSTALRAPRPSTRTAPARPAPRAAARLRVVSAPAHLRSRAGLVASCATLLIAGLVGLLVLNVSLERGAYQLNAQHKLTRTLTEQRQALQEQLAALAAPEALAVRATALGMVPAPNVAVIRRSDGKILGVPLPATAARPVVKPAAAPGAPSAVASPAASPSTPQPSPSASPARGTAAAAKPVTGTAAKSSPSPSTTAKPVAGKPVSTTTATTKAAKSTVKPPTKPATTKATTKPITTTKPAAKPVTTQTATTTR